MKLSIRKFLLVNLLLAITITTTLTAIGNYYLDQKDIQKHLDTLMVMVTLSYQALLGDEVTQHHLTDIQRSLNDIPKQLSKFHADHYFDIIDINSDSFAERFNFQVIDDDGNILLKSPNAPETTLPADVEGFRDVTIAGDSWRLFALHHPNGKFRTVVAERYDTRNELGQHIAQDDLYIMLLTFPLSGLLIWLIIGRGLDSLARVTREVADRAPTHLDPVKSREVPEEIKPLVNELNKLFTRLQQAFEREKRFAADAAHELRTPLAALKIQAQVAQKAQEPEERETALKNIINGVNRSTHIIQQLLTMSRIVPEATIIEASDEVNLAQLTAEMIAQLVPAALEKETDIELKTDSDLMKVKGNITALSILIRNLIDNAIRYSPRGSFIKVVVHETPKWTELSVTDNGPGIPVELRDRVFERFYRILGNQATGSGLGLAIVGQIAKLHDAPIELLTPKSGHGLEVLIKLHRVDAS